MELPMPHGIMAEADYWPGAADKPAILILHGFLQTREFPTVRRLAESLADEGFSVLTPSLTLGLDRRAQSLACEAIHTHSMEQDTVELLAWSKWLAKRTGKSPVLIGHSTGGVHVAAVLAAEQELHIERALLISVTYFGDVPDAEQMPVLKTRAMRDMQRGDDGIETYALGYCREYATTAANFLSYLAWDRGRLEQVLTRDPGAITVIVGDSDELIDEDWLEGLRNSGVTLRSLAGADHFFNFGHEFDLLDEVLHVISEAGHG